MTTRYPHLLSQGRIGTLDIRNRILVTAMGVSLSEPDGTVGERLIAYHEVGHALITTLEPHADKLDKVTLLPRAGGVGGFARTMPDEDVLDSGLISKAYLQV